MNNFKVIIQLYLYFTPSYKIIRFLDSIKQLKHFNKFIHKKKCIKVIITSRIFLF
jgi:hypothetical protein